MTHFLIKTVIRSLFVLTSRNRAKHQAQGVLQDYMSLAQGLTREEGSRSVEIPQCEVWTKTCAGGPFI